MITEAQLKRFCKAVEKKIDDLAPKVLKGFKVVEFETGHKYARIITRNVNDTAVTARSCFCFVDMFNGDILKSDGWKRPAKGKRGSILNGANDVTQFGAKYLSDMKAEQVI